MGIRKNKLSISEILSMSFDLYKNNFIEIIKAIGIFILPMAIIQMVSMNMYFSNFMAMIANTTMYSETYYFDKTINTIGLGSITLGILLYIVSIILALFGYLVISKMLDCANKNEEVSWIIATKYVWKKKWGLLGLNILVFIMFFVFIFAFMFLSILIALITLGIGFIIIIPLYLALIIVLIPLMYLFNSTMLVRDLGVIDSIRETFLVFKKGYFWSTIGKLSAMSGIVLVVSIILMVISFVPIIGNVLCSLLTYVMWAYFAAYLNIFVLDRARGDMDNLCDDYIDPII